MLLGRARPLDFPLHSNSHRPFSPTPPTLHGCSDPSHQPRANCWRRVVTASLRVQCPTAPTSTTTIATSQPSRERACVRVACVQQEGMQGVGQWRPQQQQRGWLSTHASVQARSWQAYMYVSVPACLPPPGLDCLGTHWLITPTQPTPRVYAQQVGRRLERSCAERRILFFDAGGGGHCVRLLHKANVVHAVGEGGHGRRACSQKGRWPDCLLRATCAPTRTHAYIMYDTYTHTYT